MKTRLVCGVILMGMHVIAVADRVIPPVIASETRSEQPSIDTAVPVKVISRDEIESSGAKHLAEVLRGHSTIHLTDTFGDGARATVGMRGFGESANANTLILVDGRRLNNMDIAAPDLNSISLKDVERVEVIQGSSSVLYGDQAVGGVINIITRKPDAQAASIEASVGSYGKIQLQAQASRKFDNGLFVRLTGEQRQSDGYRDHNELDYKNYFALIGHEYAGSSIFIEVQSTDEQLNTPGALYINEARAGRRQVRPEFRNDYIDTRTDVFRAGVRRRLNSNWKLEVEYTYRESDGEFLQSFRNAAETIPATQKRRVNSFNPRLIGQYPMNGDLLLFTLGHDYDDSRYRLHTRFGPQNNNQTVISWYGQAVVPLSEKLKASFGVRHSDVENDLRDGGFFALYPNGIDINDDVSVYEFGLSYRISQRWRWYVRHADNFRFAKVDEYLSPSGGQVLENQTGASREAGMEYRGDRFNGSIAVYDLELENELAFDPNTFSNLNLEKTRRRGVSADAKYQVDEQLSISGNYSYVDAGVVAGLYTNNRIPMVSEHILRVGINYALNQDWQLYGELQALSSRSYSGDFTNSLDELAGYGVVNFTAHYQRKGWQVEARINNLLDKKYAEFGARSDEFPPPTYAVASFESIQPSPERNFWLSVRYQFH